MRMGQLHHYRLILCHIHPATSDTVSTSSPFTPTNMGLHNISWSASSDSFPTTPVITKSMIVTDTIYGIDYDWDSDGANASGYAYLSRTLCGQVLANVFDIFADVSMTSISFHVSENSIPGAMFQLNFMKMMLHLTQYF